MKRCIEKPQQALRLNLLHKWIFLLLSILFLNTAYGQDRSESTLSGIITDKENQDPLIGATVQIKGTKKGIITDLDGGYKISGLSEGTYTVEVSYVGYQKLSKIISLKRGENKVLNLPLTSGELLDEVVVTALGIKREEKALGYAVSKLDEDAISGTQSNNWTNALSGKVAGLNMIKSGGGPVGSNKIILRGENSLDGNSEALIIVDGVIINGSSGRMTNTGGTGYSPSGETAVDFGTGLGDINPDDIDNVSVLKGPGAAALYGARGANGAIIITTKSGVPNKKGMGITFNSNVDIETISRWPDYQYEYGQGNDGQDTWYSYGTSPDGTSTKSTSSAWGPKFNGQSYYQYDPATQTGATQATPWVPYKNNHKEFFRTGITYTNSISIDGGSGKTSNRISYTNKTNEWIIPNTGYKRNTVSISSNTKVTDKMNINVKVNYTNKSSDNLPTTGYGSQTIMYYIRGIVPNRNPEWDKVRWLQGQEGLKQNRPLSSLIDNPYVIANEYLNGSERNQLTGSTSVSYDILKNLSVTAKASLDWSSEKRSQQRPMDSQSYRDGMYRTQDIISKETSYDFMINYNQDFGPVKTTVRFGGSRMQNEYLIDALNADKLNYPGIYSFANSKITPTGTHNTSEYAVNSLYGMITTNYQFLYLDLTGRNDWSSTLAGKMAGTSNCSYFYPSANLSVILSEAMQLPQFISFLKLRASISGVGSGGTTPYRTANDFVSVTGFDSGLSLPSNVANPFLKPLSTTSIEGGLDIALFKNRLRADVTVYRSVTKNQIINATIDASTGYTSATLNAGEVRNSGVELELTGKILQAKKGLNWTMTGTLSHNSNQLVSLTPELDVYTVVSGPGKRGTIEAHPGGSLSALYGLGYKRSPDGQIVYDQNGYAMLGSDVKYLGNTMPDWRASIGSTFSWKGVSLNLLFDAQFGGVGYSMTHAVLCEEGKLTKTLPGRYNGIIGNGVQEVVDANGNTTYRKNDVIATSARNYYYSHFVRDNVESNTFSTNFIKLREVRLGYTIPKRIVQKMQIQQLVIGVYGRDLFTWTKWPAFDPEFGEINGTDITAGFETAQFPATRTIGVNLKLAF